MPKISVIMPVYNVEKYLRNCLESIINQTLIDIEIICINDGSTDKSSEILRQYALHDKRIKILEQKNSGPSAARNRGIKIAQGEYIGFTDSDDWIASDFYEKLYNAVQKYNADTACANIIKYSAGSHYLIQYKSRDLLTDNQKKISAAGIPKINYIWNKIYKRESLMKLNLPFPEGRFYEDVFWSIRVLYYLNGLVTVPDTVYYYRKNDTSVVRTKSSRKTADYLISEKDMLDFAKEKNLDILNGYKLGKRDKISVCGITLAKIFYYYPDVKKIYLFGIIPVYTCKYR